MSSTNHDGPLLFALSAIVIVACTSTAPPPKEEECDGVWQSGDTDRVCVPAPPTGGATGNGGASMGGIAGVVPNLGTGGSSTGGSVPNSFDRTYVRLRPFHDYMQDGLAHFGTPDEVREGLRGYMEATGHQRIMLLMALPGLEAGPALRSMRLFVDEVAPALTAVAPK